ncbi:MAG: Na(+)-translocating NADH-quinone reductase subunit C [Myxococcota bacterium]
MPSPETKASVGYVIGFAVAVCMVCAVLVSSAAVGLKPLQDQNAKVDRLTRVLEVAGLVTPGERLSGDAVLARYEANIVPHVIDLETGAYRDDDVDVGSYDQRRAASDPATSRPAPENDARVTRLPKLALVYHVVDEGKVDQLILPIQGYGLWSTMYGYLALERDGATVSGITFYEHGETPGLGGEIENPRWQARWAGRRVYDADGNVALEVVKGPAGPAEASPHAVDGLSGATITSRGVTRTIAFWLGPNGFAPYLDAFRRAEGASS